MGDQQTSIRISCDTRDTLPFSQIEEFQGNLKRRSKKEISKIITSILKFGFSFPFFVWKDGGRNRCLSGQGYYLGLLDDYCRNRADAESDTLREKMWDAFTNDFMTRRAPVSITIVLATPWHVDDIIGRIKKRMDEDAEFPRFKFLRFPAMSDKYPEGVLFPERFGKKWYTQQRAVLGEYGFQSLMQLEPVKRGGNMLNTECIQRHLSAAEFPKGLRWMRVWDLAHTAKERANLDKQKADTEKVEADTYKAYIDAGVLEPYEVRFLKYGDTLDNIPVPDDLKMPPVEDVPSDSPDGDGDDDSDDGDGEDRKPAKDDKG